MSRSLRVVVVGAGFAGVAAGIRLRQDGHDVSVVDKADGVGGVWRANTYPGARCDVPSHLYSLSFQRKPDWSRRYADQAEILGYLEDVVEKHGLAPYLVFNTEVRRCEWDHAAQRWQVTMRGADGLETRQPVDVVIAACGQLSIPAEPPVPGLETFEGPVFHSARWRHDVDLAGKKVGVIGTGASAVQFVPAIAGTAESVTVYQRTAPYLLGKQNRRYRRPEQDLYRRFPALQGASRLRQYLYHESLGLPFTKAPSLMGIPKLWWRMFLQRQVRDPELRARLVPDYDMGCKRLLRATDWYRTLSRPDVDLVTDPVKAVEAGGVRTADGELRETDVLVLGTGFAATEFLTPMEVVGRDGTELSRTWRGGARAYLGTMVPGYPNLFLLYGPGTNLGHSSIIFMIESQLAWVRSALAELTGRDLGWIDVRPEVQTAYDAGFRSASARSVWESGCDSWYTVEGRNTNNWPGTTWGFHRRTRRIDLADVTLDRRRVPAGTPRPVREPATAG